VVSLQQRPTNWSPTLVRFEVIAEHPPAGLGDSNARDFDHTSAENHALAMRGREPVTDEIYQLPHREAVRPHDRLGAAVAAGRQQFERAVAGWRMSTALGTDGFASHTGHRIAEQTLLAVLSRGM